MPFFFFFCMKTVSHRGPTLSPFVARREKKSTSLQSNYIQVALSFNKLKRPEVILDFEISMLTRPLCKLKLTVLLNTSLTYSEVLGFSI